MRKVVLMGNPNVGKSVMFSRLTGVHVITSNYPGTTVNFAEGTMHTDAENFYIIDAPGTYSLTPSNPAEEIAVRIAQDADIIINIVDATKLERNLYLTLELFEKKTPIIIALNLWDEAAHLGISVDAQNLEQLLNVPVIPTVALTGEGVRDLVSRLAYASLPLREPLDEDGRWITIGHIVRQVQRIEHKHHTLREMLADITIKPATGIPCGLVVLFLFFWLVRFIGETLVSHVFEPIFEYYRPFMASLSDILGPGFTHDILIGKLINGRIDYVQSMGIVTTGLFVPFALVLPYIIAFYTMLGLLEDSGYLPRLATVSDTFFHKLGMHGHGIVPLFLGFGCNVPGILATRALETIKQRFIAATLIAVAVPCMAKTAMIFSILGPYGMVYIGLVFGSLTVIYICAGFVLKKCVPGESQEIFLEIPPYRRPSMRTVAKKTWMRVRSFLAEAVPYLFLGVVFLNIFYALGIFEWLGHLFAPLIQGWLGLPETAAAAILLGFLRKDLAIGMLLPLGMTPEQLGIAVTTLTMYFPCVGTFVVLLKELGIKYMFLATGVMMLTAFLAGGSMRLLLMLIF